MRVFDRWKRIIGKERYDALLLRVRALKEAKQPPDKIAEVVLKESSRDISPLFSIWTRTEL